MSNLENIVNSLKIQTQDPVSYVYYEEKTGKIIKVSNRFVEDAELAVLEVPLQDVEPIVRGERRTDEYVIDYDVSLKQLRLKFITYEDKHDTASTMTYQIPIVLTNIARGFHCAEILDGKAVYTWNKDNHYYRGDLVWKDGSVYRIIDSDKKGDELTASNCTLLVPNVHPVKPVMISDIVNKEGLEDIIKDQDVYIWHKKSWYVAGELVWKGGKIYETTQKIDRGVDFTEDNTKILVEDVSVMRPEIRNEENTFRFEPEYNGLHVDVWYDELEHLAGQHVWREHKVYRIKEAQPANTAFDLDNAELIVDKVKLIDDENEELNFDIELHAGDLVLKNNFLYSVSYIEKIDSDSVVLIKNRMYRIEDQNDVVADVHFAKPDLRTEAIDIEYDPQFPGLHIDVWYNNLEHLAGQHVWYNNAVYKIIKDQSADTNFDENNAELVISGVKLTEDSNPYLELEADIFSGDLVMRHNRLYTVSTIKTIDAGSIVLIKEKLYKIESQKDVIVRQNFIKKCWEVNLIKYLRDSLEDVSMFASSTLHFSITAKHDPNILYRSVSFSLSDLLSNNSIVVPFKYDFEFEDRDISIYTAKYFHSYGHEIVK